MAKGEHATQLVVEQACMRVTLHGGGDCDVQRMEDDRGKVPRIEAFRHSFWIHGVSTDREDDLHLGISVTAVLSVRCPSMVSDNYEQGLFCIVL